MAPAKPIPETNDVPVAPVARMSATAYCTSKKMNKLDTAIFLKIVAPMGQGNRLPFATWDAINANKYNKKK